MKKIKLFFPVILLVVSIFVASCKKEYLKMPYHAIESFTVTDSAGTPFKAAIIGDSILLYWPPFKNTPSSITPKITISDGAGISPASGAPVSFSTNTVYTVTAQDGSKKTYKLYPMINLPAPVFEVGSPDFLQIAGYIIIKGQYFVADTNQTHLYLVNAGEKKFSLPLANDGSFIFNSTAILSQIPADGTIDTGYYKLRMISGKNTVTKGPFYIAVPNIYDVFKGFIFNEEGKTLKAGDQLSISYSTVAVLKKYYPKTMAITLLITPENGSPDVKYNIALSSRTDNKLTFQLPQNIISGSLSNLQVTYDSDQFVPFDWYPDKPTMITK